MFRPLEIDIESRVCKHARSLGAVPVKFKHTGRRDAPDRIFLCPGRFVFFIEFKRPGEACRPGQLDYHKKLRRLGFDVFVVDSVKEGKRIVNYQVQTNA